MYRNSFCFDSFSDNVFLKLLNSQDSYDFIPRIIEHDVDVKTYVVLPLFRPHWKKKKTRVRFLFFRGCVKLARLTVRHIDSLVGSNDRTMSPRRWI